MRFLIKMIWNGYGTERWEDRGDTSIQHLGKLKNYWSYEERDFRAFGTSHCRTNDRRYTYVLLFCESLKLECTLESMTTLSAAYRYA